MSVYKKILSVMQDVEYLQKDDSISFGNTKYKAISEEKVTATIRASLVKHGLVIIPVEQEHHREGQLTTVNVKYKIVDVDTGEYEIAVSSGTGVDTQDKGVGKAMTYSYKYLLLRTFAIPTGEDPDKVSSAELDAKLEPKKEVVKRPAPKEDKSKILVVISKWEAAGQTKKAFSDWIMAKYQKHIEELTVSEIDAIDQMLTKKLMEKKGA